MFWSEGFEALATGFPLVPLIFLHGIDDAPLLPVVQTTDGCNDGVDVENSGIREKCNDDDYCD